MTKKVESSSRKTTKAARLIDVAQLAGVSRATAARALGGYGSVTRETHEKIIQAAETLQYRVNDLARSMRSGKTLTIGLVVADISNSFTLTAIRSIIETASAANYQILTLNTDGDIRREQNAIRVLKEKRVDGLIVVPASPTETDHLTQSETPIVLLDRYLRGSGLDSIVTADFEAARTAIGLFAHRGHRRIALLLGTAAHHGHGETRPPDTVSAVTERADGAMIGLAEAGIEVIPSLIRYAGSVASTALEAARHLLSQSPRPTALLSGNEEMLLGVIAAAEEMGLSIGKDLSLISFDDAPWLSVFRPPISVIRRPISDLGRKSVELLISKLNGNAPTGVVELKTELIDRASVADISIERPPPL